MKEGHFKQTSFGAASDTICEGANAWPHCGMGYSSTNYNSSIIRGGSWANAEEGQSDISGIFAADLSEDPLIGYHDVGFRCVVTIDR